jgi:hypothetical protein
MELSFDELDSRRAWGREGIVIPPEIGGIPRAEIERVIADGERDQKSRAERVCHFADFFDQIFTLSR